MTDVITGDITVFEPRPAGAVRDDVDGRAGSARSASSMVVEARYVGTRSLQSWQTYNYNEINIVENGFLNEFRLAQANLRGEHRRRPRQHVRLHRRAGHVAAADLPGALQRRCRRRRPATRPATRGTNWTNTTFLGYLAKYNPQPYNFANTGQRPA